VLGIDKNNNLYSCCSLGEFSLLRVVIADDEPILREGIKLILESDADIKVVGMAGSGKEAFDICKVLKPDLILLDIKMPGTDGIIATKMIKDNLDTKVMILTTHNDDLSVSKCIENGADGYILKDLKPDELILSVRGCIKGLKIIHPEIMPNIVKSVYENRRINFIGKNDDCIDFTPREKELLGYIVRGHGNKEISKYMCLSEGSVRNLISKILKKLNLRDRMQLAVYAAKSGIV